jgi:hypothetical protein
MKHSAKQSMMSHISAVYGNVNSQDRIYIRAQGGKFPGAAY